MTRQLIKFLQPDIIIKIWHKIQELFLFSFDRFTRDPWLIFQSYWLAHYNFFYNLWQKPVLRRARDWQITFWNFFSGLKNLIQSIPASKQERKALYQYLINPYFYRPFGIIFVLLAAGVLLDIFPFWRKWPAGTFRNICAYYQFFFFKALFLMAYQLLPSKEIFVKMALAYVDIGDFKNALKTAEKMKQRFPQEKMADELLSEIQKSGG